MKKIISKPHLFFFLLIPVILILGFLSREKSIDFNLYNTNFAISYSPLSYIFAVFSGLIGLNYFCLIWAKKTPKKWLTISHIILQIISLFLFFTMNIWNITGEENLATGQQYIFDYSSLVLLLSFFFFLMATLIHLINFFTSLMSKSK